MGHDHHHHKEGDNILIAFFLNASFAVLEFFGGYFTNSMAIYSDAIHDLGDSLSLLLSYFAEKWSLKGADENFNFGYRRFSILSAFVNGIVLFMGSSYVVYESLLRLSHPEPVVPEGMLGLALLGILVNGIAAFKLSKGRSLNTKMVMYHLLEDLLGWIAVLVVSVILMFKPWYFLDSILSLLISFIIFRGVYKNIIKIGNIILQKFPENLDLDVLKKEILGFELVRDIHGIKGWSIDDETYYLSFHLKISGETTLNEIDKLKRELKLILLQYKVQYSTIEFESEICG